MERLRRRSRGGQEWLAARRGQPSGPPRGGEREPGPGTQTGTETSGKTHIRSNSGRSRQRGRRGFLAGGTLSRSHRKHSAAAKRLGGMPSVAIACARGGDPAWLRLPCTGPRGNALKLRTPGFGNETFHGNGSAATRWKSGEVASYPFPTARQCCSRGGDSHRTPATHTASRRCTRDPPLTNGLFASNI